MILSLEWLSEFVNTAGIDTKQFCDRMTATGSKVEGFEVLGDDIQNVKVGRIVGLRRHENSDHLQICDLDIGGDKTVQIVTGAQNVFEGAIVPVAVATATGTIAPSNTFCAPVTICTVLSPPMSRSQI